MNTQQKAEMALKAAQLAKAALDMMACYGPNAARMRFNLVIKQAKELDGLLKRLEGNAKPRLHGKTMKARPDPWDYPEEDDECEPRDEYEDDEYCRDCGRPSHAIDNGLCPMCFECTGGVGLSRTGSGRES